MKKEGVEGAEVRSTRRADHAPIGANESAGCIVGNAHEGATARHSNTGFGDVHRGGGRSHQW